MDCVLEHPFETGRFDDGDALRPGGLELTVRAMQCAGFTAGMRVLDLGCGGGAGTALLHRHGCEVIGLDLSPARLADACRESPAVGGDARRLPFADESMDGILAECSLSLAGYDAGTLTECRRVLRPGGRLAITDVYARHGDTDPTPLPGCLAGLAPRADILAALAEAGVAIPRWEDPSDVQKVFLAQLIFSGRGAGALWTGDGSAYTAALRAQRPGYFLLVAGKPTRSQ